MVSDISLVPSEFPAPLPPPPEKRVWGGWATAGLGAVVLVAFAIVQGIVAVFVLLVIGFTRTDLFSNLQNPVDIIRSVTDLLKGQMGLLQSFATIISGIACTGLIFMIIRARRRAGIAEYLGLKRLTLRGCLLAVGIVVGFTVLSGGLNMLLGKNDNEQIMIDIYKTSVWPALFWIAVVVFAPLFEEVFFRGFLFEGFRQSRMGAAGAIGITALVWAAMHGIQYGVYSVTWIFMLGIVMGIVRLKTGSLWNTIIMHALVNLIGVLEIALNIDRLVN